MHVRLCLSRRLFSSRWANITVCVTQLSTPATRSSRNSLRGEPRRKDWQMYMNEPRVTHEGIRDPTQSALSVAEGLEATTTVDCVHPSFVERLRVLTSGSLLTASRTAQFSQCVGTFRPKFVVEVCVSFANERTSG